MIWKKSEKLMTLGIDFLVINLAYLGYYWFRVRSGWFAYPIEPELWVPMLAMYGYWLVVFLFFGMYRSWYAQSRIDELLSLLRATTIGALILFFLIFVDDEATESRANSRLLIFAYWATVVTLVSVGRLAVRFVERRLLLAGIGARNTLIVGWSKKAYQLCDMLSRRPALGYKVIGFVEPGRKSERPKRTVFRDLPLLGSVDDIPALLEQHRIQEVFIGLDSTEHPQLLDVIRHCNGHEVGMKIMPDLYDIVSGQARISSIYGFPLMDVRPQLMQPWEATLKRLLDLVVSTIVVVVGIPIWLLVALAIELDSRGPVFYKQDRVGRNGKLFGMLKFRSMLSDAEKKTGPVWAGKNDPRTTRVGRLIRRFHLDEVPQFFNVLVGDMSLVGPRPERPYFVNRLSKELPLYRHRHRVRPGMTGWAQIKYKYDESLEDVKSKLKDDLFYIENISWRLDLKILFNTIYVLVRGKGHA